MTSRWSVVLVPSHSHRWTTVVLLDGVQMITSRAPFRALQIKKRWNVVFFFCIEILSMFFFFLGFGTWVTIMLRAWAAESEKRSAFECDFNFSQQKKNNDLLIRECPLKFNEWDLLRDQSNGGDHSNIVCFCGFSFILQLSGILSTLKLYSIMINLNGWR